MQKENHQTSQELLDTGSELTLNPGDPKHHGGLPVKVQSYGGQLVSGASAQVLLTHREPRGSQTHPVLISPVPECMTRIHIISNKQNPHTGSLTCGVRAIMAGKADWKPLEWPLPRKMVNQKE